MCGESDSLILLEDSGRDKAQDRTWFSGKPGAAVSLGCSQVALPWHLVVSHLQPLPQRLWPQVHLQSPEFHMTPISPQSGCSLALAPVIPPSGPSPSCLLLWSHVPWLWNAASGQLGPPQCRPHLLPPAHWTHVAFSPQPRPHSPRHRNSPVPSLRVCVSDLQLMSSVS